MAKPPPTPPSSDIDGVHQDAKPLTARNAHPDPGTALKTAQDESAGRPKQTPPQGESGKDMQPRGKDRGKV